MTQVIESEAPPGVARRLRRNVLLLLVCRPDRLIAVIWWRICGKKLRAKHRLEDAIRALPFAHERWTNDCGLADLAFIKSAAENRATPAICVHLHISREMSHRAVRRTIASIARQSLAPMRLFVTNEVQSLPLHTRGNPQITTLGGGYTSQADGLRAALQAAADCNAAYLVPLTDGVTLLEHGLAGCAADLLRLPGEEALPPLLYGDQREAPLLGKSAKEWLKPEWDPRMFLSQDYLSRSCALPVDSTLATLDDAPANKAQSLYELLLLLTHANPPMPVHHVRRSMVETARDDWRSDGPAKVLAVERAAQGAQQVESAPFATARIRWPLPDTLPRVSVIVPTRDNVELLRTCVQGVLNATSYPELELIVADNDSRDADALAYIASVSGDPRVQIVRWPHPFNYSAINNHAAGFATGEFLCLLNNDIEVIEPDWLTELVREAVQPDVGAVGAKLLYPDRSIQHAGVAIGLGNAAGHAHRDLAEGQAGYYAQAHIARGASAVTAACLLVARKHFDAVGGLDEVDLAVAYNDVDLCLKLQAHGLTNIYTPAATLVHHESKSRGLDFAPEHMERYMRELEVFQKRWDTDRAIDPWHHPALDRGSETYRSR